MYELTIKQKLVDYYCFCIAMFVIAIALGISYFFPSEYGNHISYIKPSTIIILYVIAKYFLLYSNNSFIS